MGRTPGIALIGLVLTGITLSGCESCAACRASKPASATPTTYSSTYATPTSNSQARTTTGSPLDATASSGSASQSARIPNPGMVPVATSSSLNAASQTAAQFPGLPSSQPAGTGMSSGSRLTSPSTVQAPAPAAWPSGVPAAGTAMSTPDAPPANASQTRDSSYQTRYPDLQPASAVPTMPKPGQNPNP